ncbi:hypothetical protein DFH11DRAFT_625972 [Phellopilus nigrolimitatus]|nr:hypothetical protein DFH11DRAFT_625972 [Phellopilus nigrolimitatus]
MLEQNLTISLKKYPYPNEETDYTFLNTIAEAPPGSIHMDISTILSRTRDMEYTVYRAPLGDQCVIVKLYVGEDAMTDLEKAAENYKKYHEFQGILFPHLHGVFKGESEQGTEAGCLVLEDCGSPFERELRLLPLDLKEQIFEKIVIMHDHGFKMSDYDEDEVVFKRDEFRFLGVKSIVEHECTSPDRHWRIDKDGPPPDNLSCPGLRGYASNFVVGYEFCPSVRIGSVRYDLVDDHKDLPSQAIVDKLTPAEFHDTNRNSEILRDYMELAGRQGVIDEQSSIDAFKQSTPLPGFPDKARHAATF